MSRARSNRLNHLAQMILPSLLAPELDRISCFPDEYDLSIGKRFTKCERDQYPPYAIRIEVRDNLASSTLPLPRLVVNIDHHVRRKHSLCSKDLTEHGGKNYPAACIEPQDKNAVLRPQHFAQTPLSSIPRSVLPRLFYSSRFRIKKR